MKDHYDCHVTSFLIAMLPWSGGSEKTVLSSGQAAICPLG